MARLIDADALMNLYAENEFSSDMGDAMEMLDHFPTVDAVPVIRCKDCKWYEMGEEETYCRELGIFNTDYTSYCSYAKRKEE